MKILNKLTLAACLLVALCCQLPAASLTTFFNTTNSGGSNSTQMFDINVLNGSGITITSFEVNNSVGGAAGQSFTLNVYTTPTTLVGKETNAAAWTLVSSGTGVSALADTPIPVDVTDFFLAPGTYGLALSSPDLNIGYSNAGASSTYSNADISLSTFKSTVSCLFCGTVNARTWNGTINYNVGSASTAIPEPATLLLSSGALMLLLGTRRRQFLRATRAK